MVFLNSIPIASLHVHTHEHTQTRRRMLWMYKCCTESRQLAIDFVIKGHQTRRHLKSKLNKYSIDHRLRSFSSVLSFSFFLFVAAPLVLAVSPLKSTLIACSLLYQPTQVTSLVLFLTKAFQLLKF